MNEQAIIDSYNTFVKNGYTKSIEEFKKLIASNPKALEDSYGAFKGVGYTKSIDEYKTLMGVSETPAVEKKNPVVSSDTPQEAQPEEQGTTDLSSEGTSSVSPSQQPPQAQPNAQAQVAIPEPEGDGILSKIGNAALKAEAATLMGAKKVADVTTGLLASPLKWFLDQSDNIVNAQKNMTKQGGFFDEDIPDTDKPISDALKQKLEKAHLNDVSPFDPRYVISSIATIANKVINSALTEKQRNAIINNLALTSYSIQSQIEDVKAYQEKTLPKNVAVEVANNILYMAPEIYAAGKMGGPASAESKAAEFVKKATEKSAPMVAKYAPKAAKVLEESIVAPFTKIMATEAAVKSMANTKEGENVFWNGVEGAAEGTLQGMEMHGLGMAAAETATPISKFISKANINSAIASAIATPLANAAVFTTARALRTAAAQKRMLTQEEVISEASMGVGFSLLHLKDQFDTHNEANHYYDNVLNDNKLNSFGRVINETKANLDLAYNPALTPEKVKELQDARDEIRKAILREPDLKKKQMLGDEAVKIQNQLDAHNNIQSIVDDKDFIISQIKDQPDLSDQQKTFYINKIQAIADTYDMSDFAVTKRDLNTKITEAQKELDDAAASFTNLKSPSDRAEAKIKIDEKRLQLDELNNQLTELITNKQKQDAIQKQTADEALLRAGRERLGLQQVGEGDAELNLTPEQKQAIIDEKDAFQEILDNPDNHDESDVQEAKDYFADPIAYYEGKIKFYEEETNPTEDDKASLEYFKKMLEAQKATEVKTEDTQGGLNGIESFETSQGSVYTVLPDGRTQRFKTATGEQNEPQDLTVFVKFKDAQQEQDFLNGAQNQKSGTKVYVIDEQGNRYSKNSDIKGKDVKLALVDEKTGEVLQIVETKQEPTEGYNTYDERRFTEDGQEYREKHIGNKVSKITTKEIKPEGTTIQAGGATTVSESTPDVTTEATVSETIPQINEYINNEKILLEKEIQDEEEYIKNRAAKQGKLKNIKEKLFYKFPYYEALKKNLSILNKNPLSYFEKKLSEELDWKDKNPYDANENTISYYREVVKALKESQTKTSTPEVTGTAPAKGTTITIGAGGATTTTSGGPTEVTTGGEGTETATSGVETTAKVLAEELNKRKSSVAVKLRRLVGLITHGGENVISKFDFSKIKGGVRGRYGKGIYFSNLFKNFDYGNKSTFLKSSGLNLMNGDMTVSEALQKLSLPTEIRTNISKLETLLNKTKNSKDYNEISKEIETLKSRQLKLDKNADYIQRALEKAAKRNPNQQLSSFVESLESQVIESNNLDKMRSVRGLEDSFNNLLLESGFDGINVGDGHEIVIIPQEKINDLLVSSQEKFISEEYNKAKADGSNPELVNAVEEIIGKPESTTVTIEAPKPVGGPEYKTTSITMAKGRETKTGVMDDIELLIPKYKEYVDRDLQKAKDRLKIAKAKGDKAKIEEAKIKLEKAKAEKEEYKTDVAKGIEKAMKVLTESDMYKNADNIQQDALVRDLNKRFGESQPSAPSPEKLAGTPKPEPVTMSGKDVLKEQIKSFARGAKAGVQGIRDSITQIVDYVKGTDINTKDLKKVMDVLKSKIETETDLNKAIEKVFKIVDSSDTDIIEISKTKVDKDKMKAELEGFKKGKKSVADRVKQIREYFESVKEFGNLTRKDLSKVMREIANVQDEKTLDKAVDKINTIIDKAKTDILEISELKMIKDKMKGIKDAKKDLNEKRKLIAAAIDFIKRSGNVNAKKVGKMLRDIGKVNLEDDTKIEKIIEYAEKVFEDAQYDEKLTKANALKKSISKLSADAKKNVHLTTLGKAFAKLKASTVDDIDAYIDVASKIKESLVGSKEGDKDNPVRAAEMVNIEESMNYINENMDAQLAKAQEDMAAEILEKLGVDATGMTIDEMRKMLEEKSDDKKKDQTIIKDGIKKMFDSYTAIIKHIFETGKDPFTGEEIEFDAEQKRLVSEFMGMDLDLLNNKKSLEAMDALSNFLQNGSTAKMEDIVMRYKGERNARIAEAQGLKAKQLKFYFNGWMGRTMAEQIATLPTLTEMLFKSQSKSALFDKLSGLTEMRNKKTLVTTISTALNGRYIKQFYDRKANGKDFTDVSNITERGVIAAVKRTMVGTPEQQQAEFNRKKKLIEDSIDNLKRGVEKERSLAKIYEKAYDKLLKDSNTVDDVLKKADKNNIDAVEFWVREWDAIYDKLSDVSENVYNQILDRDVNYTPDRYTKLYNKGTPEELAQNTSLFNGNNGSVFKKKTGVLEKIERSEELPKNESDKVSRYLDLSFDKTNVNAMHDALMDINTAGVVRQIESFFKSDAIDRIIPNGEDRAILYNDSNTGRVQDFIRASRNKQLIDSTEAAKAARRLSVLATIGTSTALGSVWQPLKQIAPVAINTLINTSGKLDFNYFMGPKRAFLDKVGYGISTRGLESQTQIKSINKLVDLAAKSKGAKAMEYIEKANQFYLKAFLQAPDVYIARASWMSYYEKALEKQGIDPKTIDYESHEVNKDAADYAQKMVDRQQNISDRDLNGKLLGSKKSGTKLITSIVMPFASFRLNQFMRATNDIATLTSLNKDASITPADKRAAAASLAGYTAEMAAFKFIAYSVSLLMGNVTNYIMGKNETEEEKTKRENNLLRGQVTGTITDIFSPIPPADILYAKGADKVLSAVQDLAEVNDEDKFKLMTSTKSNDFAKSFGVLGIGISKYQNLQDAASLAYSGEFTDEYGRKKYIAENDKEALKLVVGLSALANLGLLPADANTITRNAIATAKRGSSTKPSGGEDQEDKEMNKENKEAATQNKINVLNDMLTNETDVDKKAAIEEKINSLSQDKQDKKDEQELTAQEKADKEALLGGYDSEEDLKRYNRNLYDINFGPNSDWYQEHNYEKMINNELDKKLQKEEDVKNNYYKSDKNPDGTKKRKKKEYSWSKYKKYSR